MSKLKPQPINRWFMLFGAIFIAALSISVFYLTFDVLKNYLSSPDTFFYYKGIVLGIFSPIFFIPLTGASLYCFIINDRLPPKINKIVGPILACTGVGLLVINIIGGMIVTSKIEKDGYIVCKVKLHSVKYAKNRALCKKNKSDD